jgi:hypothetical protein
MSHSVQVADDGFADMAAESSERFYLKFSNGGWIAGKEKKPIDPSLRLIAVSITRMWVKWQGGSSCRVPAAR